MIVVSAAAAYLGTGIRLLVVVLLSWVFDLLIGLRLRVGWLTIASVCCFGLVVLNWFGFDFMVL